MFPFFVPEPAAIPSFFVFSLPKSGSTLLMQMVSDVCTLKGIPTVDLATEIFRRGIQPAALSDDINVLWQKQGFAYLGFRAFFPAIKFDFSQTKNLLLIRDPRDMLVSLYFSLKYSHVEPDKADGENPVSLSRAKLSSLDIDNAVLNMAPSYKKMFQDYLASLPWETTRVYRYEDVIFKKREWLEDILCFLEIDLPNTDISRIATRYDVLPSNENPHKHIRQVIPGNYKKHLRHSTIEKLDIYFAPIRKIFCYDSVVSLTLNPDHRSFQNIVNTYIDEESDKKILNDSGFLSSILMSSAKVISSVLRKIKSY